MFFPATCCCCCYHLLLLLGMGWDASCAPQVWGSFSCLVGQRWTQYHCILFSFFESITSLFLWNVCVVGKDITLGECWRGCQLASSFQQQGASPKVNTSGKGCHSFPCRSPVNACLNLAPSKCGCHGSKPQLTCSSCSSTLTSKGGKALPNSELGNPTMDVCCTSE